MAHYKPPDLDQHCFQIFGALYVFFLVCTHFLPLHFFSLHTLLSLTFLAHLSTRCSRWAIVITLCPASVVSRPSSVVCRQQFIQSTSPPKLLDQFQNNFTQMFPWSSFTKIAKMVPLRWTKWPSELKIEKPLNDISSQANGPISK